MHVEVAVVGSSISGAATALQLQLRGISTAVFDRKTFPRPKPCGEGLCERAVLELRLLGLEDQLLALPHHEFQGFVVWSGSSPSIFARSRGYAPNIGISRLRLDDLLASAVSSRSPGTLYLGDEVRHIERTSTGYLLRTSQRECRARCVVLADGAHSRLARRLGFCEHKTAEERFGICLTVRGTFEAPLEMVHIFPLEHGEVYATQTAADLLHIAILCSRSQVPTLMHRGQAKVIAGQSAQVLGVQGEFLGGASGTGPLGCFHRSYAREQIFLVGDCLESLDPIGGMGMTHALVTARLAANSIASLLRENRSAEECARGYRRACTAEVGVLRGFTRAVKFAVRHPGVLRVAERSGLAALAHEAVCRTTPSLAGRLLSFAGLISGAGWT